MSQEYTITALTNRNKPDKFNNQTFTVKFAEHAEAVYAAFKTAPNIGDKKYGDIIEGEFGGRFKGAQRPEFEQGGQTGYSQPNRAPGAPQVPRKSDEERSQDIRWGLCIKEANAYVTKHRPDLAADKWAQEVNEYANALYLISDGPQKTVTTADVLPDDEDMDKAISLADIPF